MARGTVPCISALLAYSGAFADASALAQTPPIVEPDASCAHVIQEVCEKQNTALLVTAGAYVVVCVLLVSIWRTIWNKRGTGTPGVKFVVPMLVGATAAGLLAGFDPFGSRDLKCCLADSNYKSIIYLQDLHVGRAFLFGVLPTLVLYFIVTTIQGTLKR